VLIFLNQRRQGISEHQPTCTFTFAGYSTGWA